MIVTARPRRSRAIVPWFDQGACSFVPTWNRSGTASGRVKSAACGGTGATRSLRLGASMARTHDLPRPNAVPPYGQDVVARRSVTAVSAGRLNRGDGVQIEIDHVLKCCRGGTVAQAFGQGLEPRGAFGLDRGHLGQRFVPALRSASPRRRRGAFDGERWLKRQPSGAMTGLALGVAQRDGTFGHTATGHDFLRYVTTVQGSAGRVEAVVVEDRELVHRLLPMMRGVAPPGGDITQCQPYQLARRVVGGKMTPGLDDLAQLGIHAFDRVGGVDHPPDLGREREEWDDLRPGPPPRGNHGRELPAPFAVRERIQSHRRGLGAGCRIDWAQRLGQHLAVLPAGVIEAVADQM